MAAEGVVPNVVWLVLFGGGILTVSVTFSSTPRICGAQTPMTGLLALLIFFELTNVDIDRPFFGPVKVGPEAKNDVPRVSRARPVQRGFPKSTHKNPRAGAAGLNFHRLRRILAARPFENSTFGMTCSGQA